MSTLALPPHHPLTPHILLIYPTTPHALHGLLSLRLIDTPLLRNNLGQHLIDLPRHMARVATDIEVALLKQEVVDQLAVLAQEVLHIDFVLAFAGEGVEDR